MDAPLKRLKPWHRVLMEYIIAHPNAPVKEMAEYIHREEKHIIKIKNSPVFREELAKRLKEVWSDATAIAQDTMINLAANGDRQAAQFILESAGYKPKEQVQISADGFTINITDEHNT